RGQGEVGVREREAAGADLLSRPGEPRVVDVPRVAVEEDAVERGRAPEEEEDEGREEERRVESPWAWRGGHGLQEMTRPVRAARESSTRPRRGPPQRAAL